MFRLVIGGALALAMSFQAQAGTVSHYLNSDGREVVSLSGDIVTGDADQVTSAIRFGNDAGIVISGIRLNSLGGNLVEGIKIANIIRFAKIATVVVNGTKCASACFIAFAAGAEKYVSYSAFVGVHGASSDGQETEGSRSATIMMAKVVKDLGVPPGIIGQMVVTPPDQIVWLQPSDLQSMGVTMTGKPNQTVGVATVPQVPLQIAPLEQQATTGAPIVAEKEVSKDKNTLWRELVARAIDTSSKQNNGNAIFNRVCQPEFKQCSNAIFYQSLDGKSSMVRTAEDLDGKILSRDVCTFNQYSDIRVCLNWDTGNSSREVKNGSGVWIQAN